MYSILGLDAITLYFINLFLKCLLLLSVILEQPPLNLTPEELQEPHLDDIQEERSSQIGPGEIPDVENEQVLK